MAFCFGVDCWQQNPCLLHQGSILSSDFPWLDPLIEDDAEEERERYNKIKQREAERHAQRPWRSSVDDLSTGPRCLDLGHCVIRYQVCPFTPSSAITFTGRRIWDSALVLCKYMQVLAAHGGDSQWLAGKKVLELGAGLALPTLAACAFGASTAVCTDMPHQVALMEENIALNGFTQARAMPLAWGVLDNLSALGAPFDLVLCSDVLFSSEGTGLLVDTLCSVCSEHTLLLASNEHRWTGAGAFYDLLRARGFRVDRVDNQSLDAVFRGPDFHVIRARREKGA